MKYNKLKINQLETFKDIDLQLDSGESFIVSGNWVNLPGRSNAAGKSLLFYPLSYFCDPTQTTVSVRKQYSFSITCDNTLFKLDNGKLFLKGKDITTPRTVPEAVAQCKELYINQTLYNLTVHISQLSLFYDLLINGTATQRLNTIREIVKFPIIDKLKIGLSKEWNSVSEKQTVYKSLYTDIQCDLKEVKSLPKIEVQKIKTLKKQQRKQLIQQKDKVIGQIAQEQFKKQHYNKRALNIDKTELKELLKRAKKLESGISNLHYNKPSEKSLRLYKKWGYPKHSVSSPVVPKYCDVYFYDEKTLGIFNRLTKKRDILHNKISQLKKLERKKTCPTCFRNIDIKLAKKLIKKYRKQEEKIEQLRNRELIKLQKLQFIHNVIEDCKDFKRKEIDILLNCNTGKMLLKLEQLVEVYTISLSATSPPDIDKLKKLIEKRNKLNGKLERIEEAIYKQERILQKKEQLQETINSKLKKIKQVKPSSNDLKYLPTAVKFVKSNKLQYELYFEVYKKLTMLFNELSGELYSPKVTFNVSKERNIPAITFSRDGKEKDIRFMSGGDKKRLIALASHVIPKFIKADSNILIVDEIDANVDKKGVESILRFLHTVKGKKTLFFITARDDVKNANYRNLMVIRDGNNSRLEVQ